MQKILCCLLFLIFFNIPTNAKVFEGNVSAIGSGQINRLVDSETKVPIENATITLPQNNYTTKTDKNGEFRLKTEINGSTILSVDKTGYKPFSLTINQGIASRPMILGIEKSTPKDIIIDKNMFHLGDNSFSETSANAGEFRIRAVGPFYTKRIMIDRATANTYLKIGSIIGVDTKMARQMGHNKIVSTYATPPEIFFNGVKIAEIQLNGDNQKIRLPFNLIKISQINEITIKTGRNVMQTDHIDYDDMEFANLCIECE